RKAGKLDEAQKYLKKARGVQTASIGLDYLDVVSTLNAVGMVVREAGRPGEAADFFRRGLETLTARPGPGDFLYARTLILLGASVQEAGGQLEEAEGSIERAADIQAEKLGQITGSSERPCGGAGRVEEAEGRVKQAERRVEEAEALLRRALAALEKERARGDVEI
ncbi:unnamed protein product, partial [Scytosiphon promiscuus]